MNMAEVVEVYLARQRSLGMRFESAERLLHRFCRTLGNPEVSKVTPELVATFLRGQGNLSASWLLRYRVLTGLYRFAVGRGYVACSPLPTTLPKLPPQQTPYVYSTEDLRRLLDATEVLRVGAQPSSTGDVPNTYSAPLRDWHADRRGAPLDPAGCRLD